MKRRHVLVGIAAGVPLVAGCNALPGESSDGTTHPTTEPSPTESPPPSPTPTMAETTQQTPTATVTSSPTPPPTPTHQGPTTTGAPVIDPANLTTYTSETHPFTVKYPGGWRVNSTPSDASYTVKFIPPSGRASMGVLDPRSFSGSPDQVATRFIRSFKQAVTRDGGTVVGVNRQPVTLPNGHRATLFDFRVTLQSSTVTQHASGLLTTVNGTNYGVFVIVPEPKFTPTVKKGVTAILTSLTITSG